MVFAKFPNLQAQSPQPSFLLLPGNLGSTEPKAEVMK